MTRRILLLGLAIWALAPAAASAAPAVSVDDVSHVEGSGTISDATFTVRLSEPAPAGGVAVSYRTQDGTAKAPVDYTAASGVVTVPFGAVSAPVDIAVSGDALSEADETFALDLSSPTGGATLADPRGVGTIVDDDPRPALRLDDVRVGEGSGAARTAAFTLSLSRPSGADVAVAWATSDGSARAPDDYAAASGTVVIPAGAAAARVGVAVRGDLIDEYDERFSLGVVRASGATITDGRGVATIIDDDGAQSLAVHDVRVREGSAGLTPARFAVALSGPSGKPVTVTYATVPRSAAPGSDYVARSGTLTILPGAGRATVEVGVVGDRRREPEETFALSLARAHNASVGHGTGIARIGDDDAASRPAPVTSYRLAPRAFAAQRRGGPLTARPVGTRVGYRLSEPARVVFRVQRLRPTRGRRYLALPGSFSRASRAGRTVVRFTGRLRHRRLAPGRYRLVAVAFDRHGRRSLPRALAFRISG